jgi:predicted methyltransferase
MTDYRLGDGPVAWILHGNALDKLKLITDGSIDTIMYHNPSLPTWPNVKWLNDFYDELRRVKKPNGHWIQMPNKLDLDDLRQIVSSYKREGKTFLDPFLGTGDVAVVALLEGCTVIGIEEDADKLAIAEQRIAHVWNQTGQKSVPVVEETVRNVEQGK